MDHDRVFKKIWAPRGPRTIFAKRNKSTSLIEYSKHQKKITITIILEKKMLTQMIQKSQFRTRYGGALWITLVCFDTISLIQIAFKEYFGLIDGISLWL